MQKIDVLNVEGMWAAVRTWWQRTSAGVSKIFTVLRALTSKYRYRIVLQEEFISITETDSWEYWQRTSYRRLAISGQERLKVVTRR